MTSYIDHLKELTPPQGNDEELEELSIWQIAADLQADFEDKSVAFEWTYASIFAEACRDYQYIKDHDDLLRKKRPPLNSRTVWGIAEILDMLPPRDQYHECDTYEEAISIYCQRVDPDGKDERVPLDERPPTDDSHPDKPQPHLTRIK